MRRISYQGRINRMLMDGRWHSFEEIHEEVKNHIDPHKAEREYRKRHPEWKTDPVKTRIAKGKRRLTILHLISMKARFQVEGRGPSGDQDFRMTREAIKARRERARQRQLVLA